MYSLGRVVANGQLLRYARGPRGYTARFEAKLAERTGAGHVLTVNSGTNALITALAAAGVGPGDEVLVPAYTWVASALAPLAVGAVPVLTDIDESLTIDPEDLERKITPHTKAIIPVHMLNLVCNMDAIMAIARKHNLLVIEDACQAVGVTYKGRSVGTIGHAGAFSFNHFKNITSGEGGAVLTNDERLFIRARMFHDPGSFIRGHERSNEPLFAAMNFRVSELTGAVLHAQLAKLGPLLSRLKKRRAAVARAFDGQSSCRVAPHHDPDNAAGLCVTFQTPGQAKDFAGARGVERLIDTGRHVYTNWETLFAKRSFHPKMDPYQWASRDIEYTADMCQRTLDILARTCRVSLGPGYPLPVVKARSSFLRRAVMQVAPA
jgi:dTDP-4-amino-4,6-dideoxygalactose transaminase